MPMLYRSSIAVRCAVILGLAPALFTLGGCMLAGLAMSRVGPDPTMPARYTPRQEELLVLVEDYRNAAALAVTAEQMDRSIAEDLIAHKAAPVVNPDRLTELRSAKGDAYRQMKIPEIGRSVGAKQVVYADVIGFSTEATVGSQIMRGHAEARVRVVDCTTGQTLWPTEAGAGFPVAVDVPFTPTEDGGNDAAMRQTMARMLADKIGKLFHGYSVDQVDGTEPEMDNRQNGISGHI